MLSLIFNIVYLILDKDPILDLDQSLTKVIKDVVDLNLTPTPPKKAKKILVSRA